MKRAVWSYGIGIAVAAAVLVRDLTNPASKASLARESKQSFHGVYVSASSSLMIGFSFGALIIGTILYAVSCLAFRGRS